MESAPETQFSIYRIDFDRVDTVHTLRGIPGTEEYVHEAFSAIINSTANQAERKRGIIHVINHGSFRGLVFRTAHDPMWKSVISQIMSESYNETSGLSTVSRTDFIRYGLS